MDRDEETDEMVQQAKTLLEDVVKGGEIYAPNSDQARTAHSVQAIGILLAALVLETRALRHSQESGNRIADARHTTEEDLLHQLRLLRQAQENATEIDRARFDTEIMNLRP